MMRVSISGFKGSSKSIVSTVMEQHGYVRLSCASPLKDMVAILFNLDRELLEGSTSESRRWREEPIESLQWLCGKGVFAHDTYISPRILLQRIGTDLIREHVHASFWLQLLDTRCNAIHEGNGIVIDDARFLNEIEMCDYSINVIRYTYDEDTLASMHRSETEHLDHEYDYVIYNDGSIEDLIEKAHQLCLSLKQR